MRYTVTVTGIVESNGVPASHDWMSDDVAIREAFGPLARMIEDYGRTAIERGSVVLVSIEPGTYVTEAEPSAVDQLTTAIQTGQFPV